jgi:LysM repeat protein
MQLALATTQSYFPAMKRFFLITTACFFMAAPLARSQDAAAAAAAANRQEAEENYNILKGHVDDLIAAQADQGKQIQELKREIEDLRQQISKPTGNYASADDLKQLAQAVQDLDKKRETDKDLILKEMEKLGHIVSETPAPHAGSHHNAEAATSTSTASPGGEKEGFYYVVKKDDTLSLIAQAYREQGVKVTTAQILEANPNLNPAKLHVNMKIFIPGKQKSAN